MKTIYKTTLSIFLFSVLMVFGVKTAMGASSNVTNHCFNHLCFQTLYIGDVSQLEHLSINAEPLEISTHNISMPGGGIGVTVSPKKGFSIEENGIGIAYQYNDKTGSVTFNLWDEMVESVLVGWKEDNYDYTINYKYEIRNPQPGSLVSLGEMIAVATPTTCFGGNYYSSTCAIKTSYEDQYEVSECPFQDGFICPGYEVMPFGGEFIENPKVILERIIPPVKVTVYGWDPKEDKEYTESMTVASAENNETNVRIYWISQNATRCECTKTPGTKGDCGTGFSPYPNESVLATGEPGKGEGNYALTQTTTFKVTCDNNN